MTVNIKVSTNKNKTEKNKCLFPTQSCPSCGEKISAITGTRDAICKNCGFKDPCCE